MNKYVLVALLPLLFVACGEDSGVWEEEEAGGQAGELNILTHELTDRILEMQLLSDGLPGMVPHWGNAAVFGALSPQLVPQSAEPLLRTAGENYPTVPALSLKEIDCLDDGEGTHTVLKTDYAVDDDERSAEFTITYWCDDGVRHVKRVDGDIEYRDGGTGSLLMEEADDDDGDILTGFASVAWSRAFPDGDAREGVEFHVTLSLGGALVKPPEPRLIKVVEMAAEMRSGASVHGVFRPTSPVEEGAEVLSGSMTHTVNFPEGPLAIMIARGEFSNRNVGYYEVAREYRDGRDSELFRLEGDGEALTLAEQRRDGSRRSGTFTLNRWELALDTEYPVGHPRTSMSERGQWNKTLGTGHYERRIEYRGPRGDSILDVSYLVGQQRVSAEFSLREAGDIWAGTLLTSRRDTRIQSAMMMSNRIGDEVTVTTLRYPDGTSEQQYTKDLIATPRVNPDERGIFRFAPDGSAAGNVTVYAADFDTSGDAAYFDIVIDYDGKVERRRR